jgi:hypothetical protein
LQDGKLFGLRRVCSGSSLFVAIGAYAAGILLVVAVTCLAAHRVVSTVFAELAATETPRRFLRQESQTSKVAAAGSSSVKLQASMVPLHGYLPNPLAVGGRATTPVPVLFGSSGRNWGSAPEGGNREDRDDDDDDRPSRSASDTYRTLCVRLCDGYYFPISFSTGKDRLARDAKSCERSCGTQARLFVYRNPGNDVEDMVDLRGQPYRKLATAFLYRTEYVPSCRCQPNPWEAEARDRHRGYALAVAKSKGSKQAAAELAELAAKTKPGQRRIPQVAVAPAGSSSRERQSHPIGWRLPDARMGLGRGWIQPPQRPIRQSAILPRQSALDRASSE